jgi:hypothetical protein
MDESAARNSRRDSVDRSESNGRSVPEFREWSIPAVRLLQGAIYSDDRATWDIALRSQSSLESFFARIGLGLVIDEAEGLAYLRQQEPQDAPEEYQQIPRLFRKTRLGYDTSLLCVLLRDRYRQFEDEDLDNERCIVETDSLFEVWKSFFPSGEDEVRMRKSLETAMRKLESYRFVRRFGDADQAWEVRRVLKARLPIEELERMRSQLMVVRQGATAGERTGDEIDG